MDAIFDQAFIFLFIMVIVLCIVEEVLKGRVGR